MHNIRKIIALTLILVTFGQVIAQESEEKTKSTSETRTFNKSFNRWSLELNGGFNALIGATNKNIVSGGLNGNYSTSRISPFHIDLGSRFMINRFVGLKANLTYDKIQPGFDGILHHKRRDLSTVNPFEGHYYGFDIQGVVNLGQIFHFPEFTSRLGLLAHAGGGYRVFKLNKDLAPETYVDNIKRDNIATAVWGITPMVRLHDRLVLTMDFSQVYLAKQQVQLDGSRRDNAIIDGLLHNYTIGLTYNFGKDKHIDWAEKGPKDEIIDAIREDVESNKEDLEKLKKDNEEKDNEIEELKKKIDELSKALDKAATDKELNDLRDQLNKLINDKLSTLPNQSDKNNSFESLAEQKILAAYFDFDVRNIPTTTSQSNIKQLADYLKSNPSAKVMLTGYADAIGKAEYNRELSKDRAATVKSILVKQYGIDASRIQTSYNGEDGNPNDPELTRSQLRRVTFDLIK
ncbi:MAG: OmpA family protein [Chitinophagales bacterium]|nr:OmpA family protein [Chitinophagales bacterium]